MPTFVYIARNRAGERFEGTIEATTRTEAVALLERQGRLPVSIQERGAAAGAGRAKTAHPRARPPRLPARDMLVFTTELSDLLASGMKLGSALNTLAQRRSGKPGDTLIAGLRDEIVQGASLSTALTRYPDTFSKLYVSMIRAGEAGGALHEVLRRLVAHYERMQEVREKIVMALVYPLIVLVMGIGTMIFAMIYVIPKFENVFSQLGQTLPLATRILIGMSRGLANYGWALAIGVAGLVTLLRRALKTPAGTLWWHRVQLRMPLIRGVVAAGTFANFARTLETLLTNGVQALPALAIVEQTIPNQVIAAEVRKARARVTDGTTISAPLAAGKVFPALMTDMLAIGEQTGDMAGALSHIARRYENELDRNLRIFTTALEPILIVFVAIGVGFVAISILMAVFSLTNGLGV